MFRPWKAILPMVFAMVAMLLTAPASQAQVGVGVSIRIGPPSLPVYPQPICPGPGYLWTPGYWAYGSAGYYWVPGTWVMAPTVGYLWTPGYWGWNAGFYAWHPGYWGPHVGFYGGVNYGFGYGGIGFVGGEWRGGVYHYNTAVTNINTTVIHNTYNTTVINKTTVVNKVSYNGGPGGISARPTTAEEMAAREHHIVATSMQMQHEHAASQNRALLASENHGRPSIAATARPGEFTGHGVSAARPMAASTNGNHPANTMNTVNHGDRPPNAMSNSHGNSYQGSTHTNAPHENYAHPENANPGNSHPNNNHENHGGNSPHPNGGGHPEGHEGRPGR